MTTTTPKDKPRAAARERLLAAANELFYAEGMQSVGIDRIIERAGVARASLYNLFGSKEQLEAAYLASRHEANVTRLTEAISKYDSPRQRILAVFDSQASQFKQHDFHGCAFAAASTEAPPGGLVEQATDEFRAWMRALFTELAEEAGAPDPTSLGRQLHFLYDGVGLAARMERCNPAVLRPARLAVETVLDAALSLATTPKLCREPS